MLLTGFASGLPLILTGRTLQAWMTDAQVDLKTIGLTAFFGLPYSWKFLWAPLFDRYRLPFLGKRRGWLTVVQALLVLSLLLMATVDPKEETYLLAIAAILVSFFSASQDILLDAYRREYLHEQDLALGTSIFVGGYRGALWVAGGGALIIASYIPWQATMQVMALLTGIGLITTFFIREPIHTLPPPKRLIDSFWHPLKDFFHRKGAWVIILFILLFKMGDSIAGNTLMKFYNDMGYTKPEIAFWAKTLAIFTAVLGGLLGGIIVKKIGLVRSLVLFGIFQALSTAAFAILANSAKDIYLFGAVIGFEDLTSGMGSAAFLAFMAHLTNTRFSATQYALLSSLASLPSRSVSATAGWIQELAGGWSNFFVLCALLAIPGILMIFWMKRYQQVTESNQT